MTGTRISLTASGRVARLALVNPANRNAIDGTFVEEFAVAAAACEANAEIAVILIEAEGDVFSVGGDIGAFVAHRDRVGPYVVRLAARFHEGIASLRKAAAPIVVAVNGTAAGAGFSLVCLADLAIARESAKLTCAYTRVGLTPDGGGTFHLPRIVGTRRAFDLMATNPVLTAREALHLGLISRVVPDNSFATEVERLVQDLLAVPPGTLAGLKRLLNASGSATLEEQLAAEGEQIAAMAATPTTMERLVAFLERSSRKG